MIYGYARCSTNDSKQDIERQHRELGYMGAEEIFAEYISGTAAALPKLEELKERVEAGDTIVTTELSRLTRSVHQLCHLLEWAAGRRIVIKFGALAVDFSAEPEPMTEAMVFMMGVFAQAEQRMTVHRVRSGVANAKAKGQTLGRPVLTKTKLPKKFLKLWPEFVAGRISKAEYAQRIGKSRPTLNGYIAVMQG